MTCTKHEKPVNMVPVLRMDCRTSNAQLFRCPVCGARHWKMETDNVGINFRRLRETHHRLAAQTA